MTTQAAHGSDAVTYSLERHEEGLQFAISSSMPLASRLIGDIENTLQLSAVPEDYSLFIVLRELLMNAVTHGNGSDEKRQVTGTIHELGANRFKLEVKDEGDGFDYEKLDCRIPEIPGRTRQRGYILVFALADSVEFRDRGSRVTVEITVPNMTIRS